MSIYIILLPFLPSNTMAAMSESLIYGMYTNIKGDYIYENYIDKLFWDKDHSDNSSVASSSVDFDKYMKKVVFSNTNARTPHHVQQH